MLYAAPASVLYVFEKRSVYLEPSPVLSPVDAAIQANKEADEFQRDCAAAAILYGLLFTGIYYLLEFVWGVLGGILAARPAGPLSVCPAPELRVLGQWC